jgi:hypothetical protein
MHCDIPREEATYLRSLAVKQADYAALPVMEQRKQMWTNLNDGKPGVRPPVIIETWTFDRDFMPEEVFRCTSAPARSIEQQLLRNIRNHELIDDDKVIPDTFNIGWSAHIDEYGIQIPRETVTDAEGVPTGYQWFHPIHNLEEDLHLLKPAQCRVDKEATYAWRDFVQNILGDSLPVCIRTGTFGSTMLTHRVIELMGMEAFFMAIYDCPDEVHALMAFLRDNSLRMMRWAEAEGLLRSNSGNQDSFGSSYNFTTQLAPTLCNGQSAKLSDMWGNANSQETVGMSPQMFHEFCFPYYRDVVEPVGLLYYGCCEPADPFWDDIAQLPHLKKVSISRWCDQTFMAEALRGTAIVFSRKPDPNYLSVDAVLDEDAWAAHIDQTLSLTRDVFVEFIIRDVYTLHGNINNARKAVEIARQQIDRTWSH